MNITIFAPNGSKDETLMFIHSFMRGGCIESNMLHINNIPFE